MSIAENGIVAVHSARRLRRKPSWNRFASEAMRENAGKSTYDATWMIAVPGSTPIRRP